MSILTLENIHKSYNDRHLLRGVSLVVGDEERIGLLGPNGSGKSTLLRILAGAEEPESGTRTLRRDLSIGYLEQDPRLPRELTVRTAVRAGLEERATVLLDLERVHHELAAAGLAEARIQSLLVRQAHLEERLSQLGGHDVEHEVEAMIEKLGLTDPDAACATLSGGERRRVAIARLLLARPDVLLLDEPTNHLDAIVTDWLEDALLASRTALVMVTHDRYFLDRIVHRIVEIDRGELYSYDGGYGDYLVSRAEREEVERKAESSRQNSLRRETAWMRRGAPARSTKAKARIARFESLVDATPEATGADLAFEIPSGPRLGSRVIEMIGVSKSYDGRAVLSALDIEIGPGTRLGVVGPNGAGKTTFLRLCTGMISPDTGEIIVGETVKIASIDQQRTDLDPAKSVVEEVAGNNDHVMVAGRPLRIESFLEQFLFPGPMKQALIGRLSGGEKNRVLLAKLLIAGGNVLVLDEPTNDLDLMTLRTLEEALIAFRGAVIVVSHDRWFLDRVATRILHLDGSGRARMHEGDLSSLLEKIAQERDAAAAQERAKSTPGKTSADKRDDEKRAKPRRLTPWEEKEYAALLERVGTIERELASLDAKLAEPSLYTGPKLELERVRSERTRLASEIAALYARWEELEVRR